MLDDPEETRYLLEVMRAAMPFEARLTPALALHLRSKSLAASAVDRHMVSNVSYAGDEGGIVCHLDPGEGRQAIVASLTHLLVPGSSPLAAAVARYRKRRIARLKRQGPA